MDTNNKQLNESNSTNKHQNQLKDKLDSPTNQA